MTRKSSLAIMTAAVPEEELASRKTTRREYYTMRKRALIAASALFLSISLCACGGNETTKNMQEETTSSMEKDETKETTEKSSDDASAQVTENTPEAEATKAQPVKFNKFVSTDFVKFKIKSVSSTKDLRPDHPKTIYRHLEKQKGKTYLYAKGTIKNTSKEKYELVHSCYCNLILDDKKEYPCGLFADENGSLSYSYYYLEPKTKTTFWIVALVPNKAAKQYKKAEFQFGFKDRFASTYNLQPEDCTYLYSITDKK